VILCGIVKESLWNKVVFALSYFAPILFNHLSVTSFEGLYHRCVLRDVEFMNYMYKVFRTVPSDPWISLTAVMVSRHFGKLYQPVNEFRSWYICDAVGS